MVLFGIELDYTMYQATLVNMALYSNHPYSIIRGDTLLIDEKYAMTDSPIWNLGNLWEPADISKYYYKMREPFKFSLANLAKTIKEKENDEQAQPAEQKPMVIAPTAFSLAAYAAKNKQRK